MMRTTIASNLRAATEQLLTPYHLNTLLYTEPHSCHRLWTELLCCAGRSQTLWRQLHQRCGFGWQQRLRSWGCGFWGNNNRFVTVALIATLWAHTHCTYIWQRQTCHITYVFGFMCEQTGTLWEATAATISRLCGPTPTHSFQVTCSLTYGDQFWDCQV